MAVSEKKNQIKYDAAYISYVKNGESSALFITRDLATEVPTGGILIISLWSFFHERRSLYTLRMHPMMKRNI